MDNTVSDKIVNENSVDYIRPSISKVVISRKDYIKISNPDYKPRNPKAKKIIDDLMEFFDANA